MRLRQVAVASGGFDAAEEELRVALESFVTYRDPGLAYFGLHNALLPLGPVPHFVELVSPLEGREDSSAAGRYVRRFGDGGYMLLLQARTATEFEALHAVVRARELTVVHEGARAQSDLRERPYAFEAGYAEGPGFTEDGISGFHLHPKEVGCICEVAVQRPTARWAWAGDDWAKADERTKIAHGPSRGLAGATVVVPAERLAAVVELWTALLGIGGTPGPATSEPERVHRGADGSAVLMLDGDDFLHFRAPRPNGGAPENGLVEIFVYSDSAKRTPNQRVSASGADFVFVNEMSFLPQSLLPRPEQVKPPQPRL